jgi:DNA-binding transcriptional regulator YhcF (GntR family)
MLRRTQIRAEKVYREIEKAGCLTSAVIAEQLQIAHNELFYVLRRLRQEGFVEFVNFGRATFWCAGRAAAEEVFAKLTEALKKLLCRRGRFATPKEALQYIAEDKEARRLFSRHMPMRFNTATAQVIDALMRKAFGQPIETSRGRIYHILCAPAEKTPTEISLQG